MTIRPFRIGDRRRIGIQTLRRMLVRKMLETASWLQRSLRGQMQLHLAFVYSVNGVLVHLPGMLTTGLVHLVEYKHPHVIKVSSAPIVYG